MPKSKQKSSNPSSLFFIILRVALVFLPQNGCIHSNEFIPHIETFIAKTFNFETSKSWKLLINETQHLPESHVVVPYFTIGWTYNLLNFVDVLLQKTINISIVTPYTLLITPRIVLCLLSFLIDYAMYKICVNANEKYRSKLLILSSSFCTLVHCTHTYDVVPETILFALLLHFVVDSIAHSNNLLKQREHLCRKLMTTSSKETRKLIKRRLNLTNDHLQNCPQISVICILGFFNRPTFLFYAFTPIVFWLCRGISGRSGGKNHIIRSESINSILWRLFLLIVTAFPMVFIMIAMDSIFYKMLNLKTIDCHFVVTPLNFIKHNLLMMDQGQLQMTLKVLLLQMLWLFNVLGVCAVIGLLDTTKKWFQRKITSSWSNIQLLMTWSYVVPAICFLFVPEQGPQALLPILIPLVFLHADDIKKNADESLISHKTQQKNATKKYLFHLWLSINMISSLFYGCIREAGVLPATFHMSKELDNDVDVYIVTSHIDNIPQVLFMQPKENNRVFTYEMGSQPLQLVLEQISYLRYEAYMTGRTYKLYLLLTGSKHEDLMVALEDTTRIRLAHVKSFYPHVSVQAVPDFGKLLVNALGSGFEDFWKKFRFANITECLWTIMQSFDLKLYQIEP